MRRQVVSMQRTRSSQYGLTEIEAELSEALGRLEINTDAARGELSGLIRKGDTVVLKPNWVREGHEFDDELWEHVVTHPAMIEAVGRLAVRALDGAGRVVIIDGPQNNCSFAKLSQNCDFPGMLRRLQEVDARVEVQLIDLRDREDSIIDGVVVGQRKLPGDPMGSVEVHLDGASEFVGFSGLGKLYGADFDVAETNRRHAGATHHYQVSKTILSADVVINLPKLKTHKKGGITCSLKNMVGINTRKNWLPHHTQGTLDQGGDQFPANQGRQKLEAGLGWRLKPLLWRHLWLAKALAPLKTVARRWFGDTREVVRSGNWWGNQTIWRMILDLNKILFYAQLDGETAPVSERRYLSIVDGVVGGEGNGPLAPDRVESRGIIGGLNTVAGGCWGA